MDKKIESLDELIARYRNIKKDDTSACSSSGMEQFTEMVEKYQRPTFDDDER